MNPCLRHALPKEVVPTLIYEVPWQADGLAAPTSRRPPGLKQRRLSNTSPEVIFLFTLTIGASFDLGLRQVLGSFLSSTTARHAPRLLAGERAPFPEEAP